MVHVMAHNSVIGSRALTGTSHVSPWPNTKSKRDQPAEHGACSSERRTLCNDARESSAHSRPWPAVLHSSSSSRHSAAIAVGVEAIGAAEMRTRHRSCDERDYHDYHTPTV